MHRSTRKELHRKANPSDFFTFFSVCLMYPVRTAIFVKMKAIYLIIKITVFSFFLYGCDTEKEDKGTTTDSPRIKKYSKISNPKNNATHVLGETIQFLVESDRKIDSVQLEYEGKSTTYETPEFEWLASNTKTGIQKMKLTVFAGGEAETHYPRIKFLSDVSPEKYTYAVVRSLPHDRSAYTQGLFFKADTLYESTGPYLEYNGPKV